MIPPATCTTQNFTWKIKKKIGINVNKNDKEKLSSGFGVPKIKTGTIRALYLWRIKMPSSKPKKERIY